VQNSCSKPLTDGSKISHGVIEALCQLQNLRRLTIEAVEATKEEAFPIGEPECERILKYFWRHKKGVKLKFLQIRLGDYANNVMIGDDDFLLGGLDECHVGQGVVESDGDGGGPCKLLDGNEETCTDDARVRLGLIV